MSAGLENELRMIVVATILSFGPLALFQVVEFVPRTANKPEVKSTFSRLFAERIVGHLETDIVFVVIVAAAAVSVGGFVSLAKMVPLAQVRLRLLNWAAPSLFCSPSLPSEPTGSRSSSEKTTKSTYRPTDRLAAADRINR